MEEKNLSALNSAAAFVIAILSGLGVGSGGLFVAYLSAMGLSNAANSRGLNLLFFILSAGMATIFNLRSRKFDMRLIFIMSAFGILGCLIGTGIASYISSDALQKIFGGFLIFSGIYVLFSGTKAKKFTKNSKNQRIA